MWREECIRESESKREGRGGRVAGKVLTFANEGLCMSGGVWVVAIVRGVKDGVNSGARWIEEKWDDMRMAQRFSTRGNERRGRIPGRGFVLETTSVRVAS